MWEKGQSGNPNGRPKVVKEVRELARAHYAEAIETIAEIMRHGEKEETRLAAAKDLADRGYGKPGPAEPEIEGQARISGSLAQHALEIHQRLLLAETAAAGLVPEESNNVS